MFELSRCHRELEIFGKICLEEAADLCSLNIQRVYVFLSIVSFFLQILLLSHSLQFILHVKNTIMFANISFVLNNLSKDIYSISLSLEGTTLHAESSSRSCRNLRNYED